MELLPHLPSTHDVFHVSQLKQYLRTPVEAVKIEAIQPDPKLTYRERPIKIFGSQGTCYLKMCYKSYKVQRSHHSEEESTWETENYSRTNYPEFLHWKRDCTYSVKGDALQFLKNERLNQNNLPLSLNSQDSPKVNWWKCELRSHWRGNLQLFCRDSIVFEKEICTYLQGNLGVCYWT